MRHGRFGVAGCALAISASAAAGQPLRTLQTPAGDGSLMVGVDMYGAFGSGRSNPGRFDPVGAAAVVSTITDSTLHLNVDDETYTPGFLSSTYVAGTYPDTLPALDFNGTQTQATSSWSYGDLDFLVTQSVEEVFDGPTRIGTLLRQQYDITNTSAAPLSFDLARYLDGQFETSAVADGGGRMVKGDDEFLLVTDVAGDPTASTTVIAITACGGEEPAQNRYELGTVLANSLYYLSPLEDVVSGDDVDADELVDAGLGFDTSVALIRSFSLAASETETYTTTTLWASVAPADLPPGCAAPEPPVVETRTIATTPGDGAVTVTVDGYGSYGAAMSRPAMFHQDTDDEPYETTWESALFVRFEPLGFGDFLTTERIDSDYGGALPNAPFGATTGASAFSTFSHDGLDFELSQVVTDVHDGPARIGSLLTQEYEVTNTGGTAVSFDLVRYVDASFAEPDTQSGGGIVQDGDEDYVLLTIAGGDLGSPTRLLSIAACGGTEPSSDRYEVGASVASSLASRVALADAVAGDGADADQLVDGGAGADLGAALATSFTLAPAASASYTTTTFFAYTPPQDATHGCAVGTPPIVDSDHDGVPDDIDACPGYDDSPVFDEDIDADGVNDACDPCLLPDCSLTVAPLFDCAMILPTPGVTTTTREDGPDLEPVLYATCDECLPDGTSKTHWFVRVENHGTDAGPSSLLAYPGPPSTTAPDLDIDIVGLDMATTSRPLDVPALSGSTAGRVVVTEAFALRPDVDPFNDVLALPAWAPGPDADSDGWPDTCDPCPTGATSEDGDQDGIPDACDDCLEGDNRRDDDWDGTPDACDPCPLIDGDADGAECVGTSYPGIIDCDALPEAPTSIPYPCGGYALAITGVRQCSDCARGAPTGNMGFFFTIANRGDRAAPTSTLAVYAGAPSEANGVYEIEVPEIGPGASRIVGPVDAEGWFDGDQVVLARLTPSASAEVECTLFATHRMLVSPNAWPFCEEVGGLNCIRNATVDPAGGLPALALLWAALAWRRRAR